MKEDLDKWNNKKKELTAIQERKFYPKEREIWWCYFGINLGREQNGRENFIRPVLIMKRLDRNTFVGLPLTTKEKNTQFQFRIGYEFFSKDTFVICDQIRVLSDKRLAKKIGKITTNDFIKITEQSKALVFTSASSSHQDGNRVRNTHGVVNKLTTN